MKSKEETIDKLIKFSIVAFFSIVALLLFWSFLEAKQLLDNCMAQGNSRAQCQQEVNIEKERRRNLP